MTWSRFLSRFSTGDGHGPRHGEFNSPPKKPIAMHSVQVEIWDLKSWNGSITCHVSVDEGAGRLETSGAFELGSPLGSPPQPGLAQISCGVRVAGRGAPYDTMWWIGQDTAAVVAECPAEKRLISHHAVACDLEDSSRRHRKI